MAYKGRFNVRLKKQVNVKRVVSKIAMTVITLYVGGTVLIQLGNVMINTSSPFYQGLSLIGWTVNSTGGITATSGTGVLTVVGLVAIASIILEFIEFSW